MTKELIRTIPLRCAFCKSTQFVVPDEDYQPKPGDMLTCANCGRESDYEAILGVLKDEAEKLTMEKAEELIEKELTAVLKKAGFKVR